MTAPTSTHATAGSTDTRVLYLIGCAAPPVLHLRDAIAAAQHRGYDTCLILTPTAAGWLDDDLGDLSTLTGHPVRATYKRPGESDVLPPADAFLIAPATGSTINKWSAGIADNLALGLITEAAGRGEQPIVALPYLNSWQAAHTAFPESVERLRAMRVHVLLGPGGYTPHVPHTGTSKPAEFPWHIALDTLDNQLQ